MCGTVQLCVPPQPCESGCCVALLELVFCRDCRERMLCWFVFRATKAVLGRDCSRYFQQPSATRLHARPNSSSYRSIVPNTIFDHITKSLMREYVGYTKDAGLFISK